MNIILWTMQSLVAIVFFGIGAFKTLSSAKKLQQKIAGPVAVTRLLGFLEILGAIGIIFPLLLNVYPSLTAIAAICLGMVMLGAFILHISKKEYKALPLVIVLLILCTAISIYRI